MESSEVISTDKATVIIQVNPQVAQHGVISEDGQQTGGAYHNTALSAFIRAQPKALGTVQIMTGVMIFLFGIVRTIGYDYRFPVSIISGITFWGSLIYISAGSLSVSAQNKLHLCVVKGSLIMNVISAITAATAIVLMSIDIHLLMYECYSYEYSCTLKRTELGIVGILLVFSILQFIISIFISGFACKATSNIHSTVINVALNKGN
ncbi:membrane-spanning 4-domains subfamily A member 12-like isoform X2 [Carassius carassius]|uniref:membrane-spanning 4-domains subfamily A member 12-like isoform X2 n=1 Tax=Carassius carassius TaxID=217509 RepID=UPI0028694B44|nr:membrane-spanning 4-domains subfamily A member 12-like isoform X2 [Carassius carassius]